ncbi:MAG: hypothetical protein EGQ99_06030 [Porphyromonadaceae bacterium]|nr:hypothetical protein [Porphyromonadaceae bacterium]
MKHNNPTRQVSMRMFLTLVLIMMSSAFAMAQETYGIKIAGVDVTSLNCKDLSVIDGVDGKISYDPETNTLTMEDVTINTTDFNGIVNDVKDMKIKLFGNNIITSKNKVCITINKTSTISGSGTLRLKSGENCGIYVKSSLTVEGVKLYAEGYYGVAGDDGTCGEILTLRNSYVEATGRRGSICDLQNLVLDGCSITQPTGAAFDANVHAVALNGKVVTDKVVIESDSYGFKIGGVDVTKKNCKDLTEINGVSGSASYDPDTKTLTLDNATIEVDGCNAILNETCDNLLIKLLGTNTINVTNSAGIYMCESTTIVGGSGSKLTIKNDRCAVLFEGCPLEIVNCWLEVEGDWGISANDNVAEEVLKIRNSHVEATGPTGSICDIAGLELDGCYIDIPSKAAYNADTRSVALNGETVTSKVVIEPNSYGIYIADKPVTTLNYKDLTSIYGVSGSASYDPDTKTLTLDNATIERNSTDGTGIVNKTVSDFTVKLIGKNTVTADLASMVLNQTSTITGDGSLHLTSKRFCGLDMENASVTIDNTSLFVKGGYGIAGFIGAESEVLTVRNSHVEAEGSGSGSITLISNLILDNCAITQPVGAEFDADQRAVVLNGEVFKSKVVIEPVNNSIGTITADVPACKQGIYNLNGVKLTQQWDDLPAGIYIVDGVKRVKN